MSSAVKSIFSIGGDIGGAIADPVGTVAQKLVGQGLGDIGVSPTSTVGAIAQIGASPTATAGEFAGGKLLPNVGKAPALPNLPQPVAPTPSSIATATTAAVQGQQVQQGRASNILTGPAGSLTSQSNLYSAGKQLLGS